MHHDIHPFQLFDLKPISVGAFFSVLAIIGGGLSAALGRVLDSPNVGLNIRLLMPLAGVTTIGLAYELLGPCPLLHLIAPPEVTQ